MNQEFYIAGVKFHEASKIIDKLEVGMQLHMEPEPSNKYDSNAVKLIFELEEINNIFPFMLGYVPAKFSAQASALLLVSENVICEIIEVNEREKPWKQIKVVVKEKTNA